MNKTEPLCHMPWLALTVTGQGDIKPCCQYHGSLGNVHSGGSLQQARNSEAAEALKTKLANQELAPECSSCWQREKILGESRRTWFSQKFAKSIPEALKATNNPIIQMDLNLSNRCNLKCRMCGSWGSHLWADDELALQGIDRRFKRESRPEKLKLFELSKEHIDELAPSLSNLKRIDFKGGEPMMARAHPYLLQTLIDRNLHEQVMLCYTTNGTVLNPSIIRLLEKFKTVQITVSVEATGELYSYIRGGRFAIEDMSKNLNTYSQLGNTNVCFNVAIQAYNTLALSELWHFLNSFDLPRVSAKDAFRYTTVNAPAYLSPWVLPRELKKLAAERIAHIDELKTFRDRLDNSAEVPEQWEIFKKFTSSLDQLRKESIYHVIPEFTPYFELNASEAPHAT